MDTPDDILYERFLHQSDQDAFRQLLERYREGLTLFLFGYVHNLEDAEELMIDSFAEVAAGPTLFSGRSSFKTWLFSIGKHLALMRLRKKKQLPVQPLSAEVGDSSPELELLTQERKQLLYQALDRIAPEYRQTLLLIYVEDMSAAEAAQILRKRTKQVYNLAERGKRALREELERMGYQYAEF